MIDALPHDQNQEFNYSLSRRLLATSPLLVALALALVLAGCDLVGGGSDNEAPMARFAISEEIAHLHETELSIESREGEGTTVTFDLPKARKETASDGQPPSP